MAHGAVKHDYHILPPSPWPFVGSASATLMAIGLIAWIKGGVFGIEKGQWWLFALGIAGVLYTFFGWWRDVIKEANAGDHTPVVSIGLRYGMVLFIASEVMFFVAFFWAYFHFALYPQHVLNSTANIWPPAGIHTFDPFGLPFGLPEAPFLNWLAAGGFR